jgi:hypothetical protein
MTDADWLKAILAAVGVIVVAPWVTWISRNAAGSLSREEHRELCEDREMRFANDIAEIKKMLAEQEARATKSRHSLAQRIQELTLDIATLPGYKRHPRGDCYPPPDEEQET